MGSFAEARREELEGIPWLAGDQGAAYAEGLGRRQDITVRALKDAALMALGPYECPDDALDACGRDFGIERFPGELDGTAPDPVTGLGGSGYRGRLCVVWETYKKGGTKAAIKASLRAYGFVDVEVYNDEEGHFAGGDWYSRFWVVLGPDFGSTGIAPLVLGGFRLGEATLGSTATEAQVKAVKRQILKWKWAYSYPVKVILRFPGDTLLGFGTVLGTFTLGGGGSSGLAWPVGRTLNDTISTLGFELGGYEV